MDLKQFRAYGRRAFSFLVDEYGFARAPLPKGEFVNPFMVCFSNGITWVGVEGINYGSGINVRLATCDPAQMKYTSYDFDDLLAIRDARFERFRGSSTDRRELQKVQMDQYAAALRAHGDDVLRGDFTIFPRLAAAIDARWRQNAQP